MSEATGVSKQGHVQAFPPPPPFYKLYKDAKSGDESYVPPPPPPPPIEGEYLMFGELHTTEDGIPPLQGRQLFDFRPDGTIDFKGQLLRLNRELLFEFVELLDGLVAAPSAYARGLEALGLIVRNMHYLLNALRAFQARATLQHILEVEISDKKEAAAEIRLRSLVDFTGVLEEVNKCRKRLASVAAAFRALAEPSRSGDDSEPMIEDI